MSFQELCYNIKICFVWQFRDIYSNGSKSKAVSHFHIAQNGAVELSVQLLATALSPFASNRLTLSYFGKQAV